MGDYVEIWYTLHLLQIAVYEVIDKVCLFF